jgi:Fur family zinc uptake transcriptional regulator/Fur family ferric uptake transcriptional regulator
MREKELTQKLKSYGYKLTSQRQGILEVFIEYKGQVLSAEQIYEKTKKKYPKTNFSTIYRNLEIFERAYIIHKLSVDGEPAKYELVCCDEHHHHMICKGCGKSERIDFCPMKSMYKELEDREFTLTDHKFELYGYCKKCMEKKEEDS